MADRYEIIERLGRGGVGAVYRAKDTLMGRMVAIKRLLPPEESTSNSQVSPDILRKEAAALAKFQHPNIVTVFAVEEDDEGPFVVTELIEGENLHVVVGEGALDYSDFESIAEQCLEPLISAQKVGLKHRDIKPGNIMLSRLPNDRFLVKILDFGLAKFTQTAMTQTLDHKGTFMGSIDFLAPEQLELKPIDQRADLYSLGCVLYFSLTQESPFAGKNAAETSQNHLRHRCRPLKEVRPDVPQAVSDWVMRMVSRNPDDRPENASEALDEFKEAVKGISPASKPVAGVQQLKESQAKPTSEKTPETGSVEASLDDQGRIRKSSGSVQPIVPETKQPTTAVFKTSPGRLPAQTTAQQTPSKLKSDTTRTSLGFRLSHPIWTGGSNRTIKIAGAGACAFLIGLIGIIVLGGGDEEGANEGPDSAEVGANIGQANQNGQAENEPPVPEGDPLIHPGRIELPPPGEKPMNSALAIQDGLVADYLGSADVYGTDLKRRAQVGEKILGWRNLVAPAERTFFTRDYSDTHGQYLPVSLNYAPSEARGLRRTVRGVRFDNRSSLIMPGELNGLSSGFTIAVVGKFDVVSSRLIRVLPKESTGRYVSLGIGPSGTMDVIFKGSSDYLPAKLSIPWSAGDFCVMVYRWDPESSFHRINALFSDGDEEDSQPQGIKGEGTVLDRIAIGPRAFTEEENQDSEMIVFELATYNRVLPDAETQRLMNQLSRKFFAGSLQAKVP